MKNWLGALPIWLPAWKKAQGSDCCAWSGASPTCSSWKSCLSGWWFFWPQKIWFQLVGCFFPPNWLKNNLLSFCVFPTCSLVVFFLPWFWHMSCCNLQQFVSQAFREALEALPALMFIMLVMAYGFAALLYLVEPRDNMPTIAHAAWLVISTITTVGFGDVVPSTQGGLVLTSILMVVSSLYMAMPLAVIGHSFNTIWANRKRILLLNKTRNRLSKWGFGPYEMPRLFGLFDLDHSDEVDLPEFKILPLGVSEIVSKTSQNAKTGKVSVLRVLAVLHLHNSPFLSWRRAVENCWGLTRWTWVSKTRRLRICSNSSTRTMAAPLTRRNLWKHFIQMNIECCTFLAVTSNFSPQKMSPDDVTSHVAIETVCRTLPGIPREELLCECIRRSTSAHLAVESKLERSRGDKKSLQYRCLANAEVEGFTRSLPDPSWSKLQFSVSYVSPRPKWPHHLIPWS